MWHVTELQNTNTNQSEAVMATMVLEEQNRKLTKEVESLQQELAAIRSQSVAISEPRSDAMECKRLSMEVDFLQNEVKRQRDRCTELEVKLRSVSPASQACTVCDLFRSQLAAKESALAEKDSRLTLMTTRLQKLERVAQNTAVIISESKQMASQKNDLEEKLQKLQEISNQQIGELHNKILHLQAQPKTYEVDFKQELHVKYSELVEEFKKKVNSLQMELEAKETAYGELQGRYTETEQRCTDLEHSYNVMQQKLGAAQDEIQSTNQQLKQYKTQVDRCRKQLVNYKSVLQQFGHV